MSEPIHRFRHNTKAIALGNPAWEEAFASAAIHRSPELGDLQERLRRNLDLFDSRIDTQEKGDRFSIRLVPIGDEKRASNISGAIFQRGFYTSPVFFPIVERGKAGLRVMLRADNNPEDIVRFCDAVEELTGG